jgi:predicted dehydrogenase
MKCLVVGAGSIGRRHLRNLRSLDAGSLSVCETDQPARESATREFGAKGHARLTDALDAGPEVVLVCTPTHQHIPVARAALEANAHIFIEKPLAASLEDIKDLASLAQTRRRTALVGCNMRFHPGVARLKGALEQSAIKRPLYFRARFSHFLPNWRPGSDYRLTYSARRDWGGGILLEGVHEFDYLRWLGGEVVRVAGHAAHVSDLDIDGEDCALVLLQFEGGALGQIHLDYLSPHKLRGCEIIGEDGVLRWQSDGKNPEIVQVERSGGPGGSREILYRCEAYDSNLMYLEELKHFLQCLEGSATPALDIEGATRVLALALAARDAADESGGWKEMAVPSGSRKGGA